MDYLSGDQSSLCDFDDFDEMDDMISRRSQDERKDSFNFFATTVFRWLDSKHKAVLFEKFLSDDVVKVLKNKDLYECVNLLFKNNLNLSETSRNAFLHRNTLLYRIEKIYKMTGYNIRSFDDAITFKIMMTIFEKIGKGKK